MTNSPTPPPLPPPKKTSMLPEAQWVCCFIIAFTGYLFITKPTKTPGQLIFRLVLLLGGVIGLLILQHKKKQS